MIKMSQKAILVKNSTDLLEFGRVYSVKDKFINSEPFPISIEVFTRNELLIIELEKSSLVNKFRSWLSEIFSCEDVNETL